MGVHWKPAAAAAGATSTQREWQRAITLICVISCAAGFQGSCVHPGLVPLPTSKEAATTAPQLPRDSCPYAAASSCTGVRTTHANLCVLEDLVSRASLQLFSAQPCRLLLAAPPLGCSRIPHVQ